MLEKWFGLKKNGTNVRTEMLAGCTTFATMAYILIIHPNYMRVAGMDATGVLIATALVSAVITILMGVMSNCPIALAPGIASGAVMAYSIVQPGLATWEVALGMSMISAIIFFLLSVFNIRGKVVEVIPKNLKIGISAGLGLFIIRTAIVNAGLMDSGFRSFGDLSQPSVQLAAISILICLVLYFLRIRINDRVYKIKSALLLSIIISTVLGIFMGVVKLPESIFTSGGLSSLANVSFKFDLFGALRPEFLAFVLAFFVSDFFGTLSTAFALGSQMGALDKDGNFPAIGRIFLADSIGSVVGAAMGVTVVTSYAESASGIESGGRTGLANFATAALFILAIFFAPVFLMIPTAATTPVLIIIGLSMMQGLKNVDYVPDEWIPVGIMLISTLFYGLSKGIGLGLIAYCVVHFAYYLFDGQREKGKLPTWFMVVFTALTSIQFFV